MGWICPICGSENSFETKACRACGHRALPVYLARERLVTVRERLQANQFDFLGRSLEERVWDWAGRAIDVWRQASRVPIVIVVVVLLFSGMPGLFGRITSCWQNIVTAAPQVFLDRGELTGEKLLYDWQLGEKRVQAAADELYAFTESTAVRTEDLARRIEENWFAAKETAAALRPHLQVGFHLEGISDHVTESRTMALGRRWVARKKIEKCIEQYQETFTQRVQEIREEVKSRFQSPGNG